MSGLPGKLGFSGDIDLGIEIKDIRKKKSMSNLLM